MWLHSFVSYLLLTLAVCRSVGSPKRLGRKQNSTQLSDSLSRLLHVVVVSPPIYLLNYCTYRSQQKMIDLVIGVVEAKQKNQSQKTNNIGTV